MGNYLNKPRRWERWALKSINKDVMNLPDFGKTKQNSRHDLPQRLLLPSSNVIRNAFYSRWMFSFNQEEKLRKGWGWGWGSCLAISSVSRSTGRKEDRNLHISFKHLMKRHQDSELQKENQARNLRAMASQLFFGGRFCMSTPSVRVWVQPCLRGTEELALWFWWLGTHLASYCTFCCVFPVFRLSTPRPCAITFVAFWLLPPFYPFYMLMQGSQPCDYFDMLWTSPFLKLVFSITLGKKYSLQTKPVA